MYAYIHVCVDVYVYVDVHVYVDVNVHMRFLSILFYSLFLVPCYDVIIQGCLHFPNPFSIIN